MIDFEALLSKVIKRNPERLGIDLSARSVRIVRLAREGERTFKLAASAIVDVDPFEASPLEISRLRATVEQVGGGLTRAALTIEHPSLRIRQMKLAAMPERDTLEAIRWNFREHIEMSVDQFSVGFTPIGTPKEGEQRLLLAFGVAREAIEQHLALARQIGCKAVSLEPVSTALLAALDANYSWEEGNYVASILIDDHIAYFTVAKNGMLFFSRVLSGISIDALARLMMRNAGIEFAPALVAVRSWIMGGEPLHEASLDEDKRQTFAMTIGHFFSQLVIEVQRTMDAFCIMYNADRVDSLFLCGAGALLPDLAMHMEKTLGVKTVIFNPFARIPPEGTLDSATLQTVSMFATALGLALP